LLFATSNLPAYGFITVYTFPMTTEDILSHVQPWLAHWEIDDLTGAQPWLDRMSLASFDREEHLVRAGEFGDTLFLLTAGLVRLYYASPEGKERNKAFFSADQITGPVSAAITSASAPFSIQALEETSAITFHYADLIAAAQHNVQFSRLLLQLLSTAFIRNEQREAMLLTCGAQERYAWLLEHEPHLVDRVPQFHIASYLGVDAVSLSRLKKKFRSESPR